jgi:predicted ester cyclase
MQVKQDTSARNVFRFFVCLVISTTEGRFAMSAEANKATVTRYFEQVYNLGNDALIHDLFTPDFQDDSEPAHQHFHGYRLAKHVVDYERSVLPDIHFTVEDMLAEGDDVIVRLTIRGTHRGEYRAVAATGRQICITGIERLRLANGKISRVVWHHFDKFELLRQIGAFEE